MNDFIKRNILILETEKGINVPVFTHQARALTEAKEETAMPL